MLVDFEKARVGAAFKKLNRLETRVRAHEKAIDDVTAWKAKDQAGKAPTAKATGGGDQVVSGRPPR